MTLLSSGECYLLTKSPSGQAGSPDLGRRQQCWYLCRSIRKVNGLRRLHHSFLPAMHLPPTNAPHPTWIHSFTPTKLDALVLVEACLSGRLSFCPRTPEYGASFIASGFIFVFKHDASGAQELDNPINWTFVDFDGVFNILRSTNPSGLIRKGMSVKIDGNLYHLVSYYAHWDTVNGALVPPTRCLELQDIILKTRWLSQTSAPRSRTSCGDTRQTPRSITMETSSVKFGFPPSMAILREGGNGSPGFRKICRDASCDWKHSQRSSWRAWTP